MAHQNADEIRAAYVASMSDNLGRVQYLLWCEVAWLHKRWREYRDLFGTSPERIDLLNDTAPAFFHSLQGTIWEAVLMHICRLTDCADWGKHKRLTLGRLLETDPEELISDKALRAKVSSLVDEAVTKSKFARDWRNRRLAHREMPPLDGEPEALADASRQQVEDALSAIRDVMNCVDGHYMDTHVAYEHYIPGLGGVDSLLDHLKKATAASSASVARR